MRHSANLGSSLTMRFNSEEGVPGSVTASQTLSQGLNTALSAHSDQGGKARNQTAHAGGAIRQTGTLRTSLNRRSTLASGTGSQRRVARS